MTDYLKELFTDDETVIAANIAELARIAAVEAQDKAENAARAARFAAEKVANNCPRCMGSGRISAFQHFKAGVCFSCGGTGKR